jgi:hypothetical protein
MMVDEVGFWEGMRETIEGRGQLRLILQPTIALILGIRMGIADAKSNKQPFLMHLVVTGDHRAKIVRDALMKVIIPFTLAIVLDGVLQYLTLGYVRPLAAVVMGLALIAVPFAVARSLTNRIYRRRHPTQHPAAA